MSAVEDDGRTIPLRDVEDEDLEILRRRFEADLARKDDADPYSGPAEPPVEPVRVPLPDATFVESRRTYYGPPGWEHSLDALIGRSVRFLVTHQGRICPRAAQITYTHPDGNVDLLVFNRDGFLFKRGVSYTGDRRRPFHWEFVP